MMKNLNLKIKEQKNFECLSSCIKAVFDFYNIKETLGNIIENISSDSYKLYDWEFKAATLAIKKGLKSEIYSNVSQIFDPSWHNLTSKELVKKLKKSLNYSMERETRILQEPDQKEFIYPNKAIAKRLTNEIKVAVKFLEAGGKINFSPISKELICKLIKKNVPIIASLNPTLLHKMKRVFNSKPDDIKGISWGHVVIISGCNSDSFTINDPGGMFYKGSLKYNIDQDVLLESILRYNGQLIIVSK